MPDWMSHILIGLIFCELFSIRKKSLVLFGALLPDLISKLLLASFYFGLYGNLSLDSFHTPFTDFALALLIAPLFKYPKTKTVMLITLGFATHFLSDLMLRHFLGGMRLFFPFSMQLYRLDWILPEQSIYVFVFSLL